MSFSCPLHQAQALLQFKSTLLTIFNSTYFDHPIPMIPPLYANLPFNASLDYPMLFYIQNSWNSSTDCCSWDYVSCNDAYETRNGNVTVLDLQRVIPDQSVPVFSDVLSPLFQIRSLEYLDIRDNGFLGEIPGDGLGNLTNLDQLLLGSNRFHGSIPVQLFRLTTLSYLDMSNNSLEGILSPELGKLQNLTNLAIDHNLLSGNIPDEIGNLTKLSICSLGNNRFSGEIPSSISSMKELQILLLGKNNFTGPVPSRMRHLSKLTYLNLKNNKLVGEIPAWLFEIKTLKYLFIGGRSSNLIWNNETKIVPRCSLQAISMTYCRISGHIPVWISSQKSLSYLDLSGNQLEGRFPDWLAKMNTTIIILSDNKLTGTIPPSLFEFEYRIALVLSRNKLSGELPENISNAFWMAYLILSENNFSGQIPKSISKLSQLWLLDLSYNNFSGTIPATFSNETRILSLAGNKFSGSLSRNLSSLVNLQYLDLHDNDITGNFHDVLPQIPTLEVLNLRNNSLGGYIPRTISNITSLRILDLSGNNITGSIPHEIANLDRMVNTPDLLTSNKVYMVNLVADGDDDYQNGINLQGLIVNWKNSLRGLSSRTLSIYSFMDLSDNRISGEIPASLGNLKGLKVLNISHNIISGHIPASLGDLKSLESLDLSHNKISGMIPQSLVKLNELTTLDVSNNMLTGKIPVGGQMSTMSDMNFFANNSGLCGMQIRITCPGEDIPPSEESEYEEQKQSWILWEGTWIGFPIGFFVSVLMTGKLLNFQQLFSH